MKYRCPSLTFQCAMLSLVALVFASVGAKSQSAQGGEQKPPAVLASAAEAAGGSALSKITGIEMDTRREAFWSGQSRGYSDVDYRLLYPAQMRLEVKVMEAQVLGGYGGSGVPGGSGPVSPRSISEHTAFTVLEGCDGAAWWRKTPKNLIVNPIDLRIQGRIDLVAALGYYRRAAEGRLEAKKVDERQVQGRTVQVVTLPDSDIQLFVDPKTHLLAGAAFVGTAGDEIFDAFHWWTDFLKVQAQGAGREQVVWWSDYRRVKFKVEGSEEFIQFPYLWTSFVDGQKFLEEKVTSLKVNGKQNPKIFAAPK